MQICRVIWQKILVNIFHFFGVDFCCHPSVFRLLSAKDNKHISFLTVWTVATVVMIFLGKKFVCQAVLPDLLTLQFMAYLLALTATLQHNHVGLKEKASIRPERFSRNHC